MWINLLLVLVCFCFLPYLRKTDFILLNVENLENTKMHPKTWKADMFTFLTDTLQKQDSSMPVFGLATSLHWYEYRAFHLTVWFRTSSLYKTRQDSIEVMFSSFPYYDLSTNYVTTLKN